MKKKEGPTFKKFKIIYGFLTTAFLAFFVLFAVLGCLFSSFFFIFMLLNLAGAFYCFFHFLSVCKAKKINASKSRKPKENRRKKEASLEEVKLIVADIKSKFSGLPLEDWRCDPELYAALDSEAKKGKPSIITMQAILKDMEEHVGLDCDKSALVLSNENKEVSGRIERMFTFWNKITIYRNEAYRADNYICILAHEVSHAFQYSLDTPFMVHEKSSDYSEEKFTDVLAFFFGFGFYATNGRHAEKLHVLSSPGGKKMPIAEKLTIGYLNDEEVKFVEDSIMDIRKQQAENTGGADKELISDISMSYAFILGQILELKMKLGELVNVTCSTENSRIIDIISSAFGDDYISHIDVKMSEFAPLLVDEKERILDYLVEQGQKVQKAVVVLTKIVASPLDNIEDPPSVTDENCAFRFEDDGVSGTVARFDWWLKGSLVICTKMALDACKKFVAEENLIPLSIAITSYAFDLAFFGGSFMRMPAFPYHTACDLPFLSHMNIIGVNVETSAFCNVFRECQRAKCITDVRERDFANIICDGIQRQNNELITDYSLARNSFSSLFLQMEAEFVDIKKRFFKHKWMLNLHLAEGFTAFPELSAIGRKLYRSLRAACPNVSKIDIASLVDGCVENFCGQLLDGASTVDAGLLHPLKDLCDGILKEAQEFLETYNSDSINAGTTYGEWTHCLAKLYSAQSPGLMTEVDCERACKRVMTEMFEDNEIMSAFLAKRFGENDVDIDAVEAVYVYFNYLVSKKEEYGLTDAEIRIVSMLMYCHSQLEVKERRDGDARYDVFFELATTLVASDEIEEFDFGDFIAAGEKNTAQASVYSASVSAIAALNYFYDDDPSICEINGRKHEIYSCVLSLINGNRRVPWEEEEIRRTERMPSQERLELILHYKRMASNYLEGRKTANEA